MFDSTVYHAGNSSHSVTFNAVSGTLIKSTDKSKIIRFGMKSNMAGHFFNENKPYRKIDEYPYKIYITVLQVMLCGDEQFLVEYIEEEKEDS